MQDTQFKNELIDIDLEGKTLPAVTAADEGKVLTVDSSGSWAAAEGGGGGGGGFYIVQRIPIYESDELVGYKLDKNYTEIKTALLNGLYIYFIGTDVGETYTDYYIGILSILSEDTDAEIWSVTAYDDMLFTSDTATGELDYKFFS